MQALQDVEAAASAIALERVGGVGHQLQLAQYELRGDDDAVEESGFGDVGDAAVDDHAGVEDLVALLALLLAAEDSAQGRQVQQVALVGPDDQSDIGHQEHDQDLQEALGVPGGNAVADDQRKQVGAEDAEDTAHGGANQALQTDPAQPPFEQDDAEADERAHHGIQPRRQVERISQIAGNSNYENK